jgi:hypothetical protein
MMLSPGLIDVEEQVPAQFGMPGACSHGVVFEVPLFESEPLAAT